MIVLIFLAKMQGALGPGPIQLSLCPRLSFSAQVVENTSEFPASNTPFHITVRFYRCSERKGLSHLVSLINELKFLSIFKESDQIFPL